MQTLIAPARPCGLRSPSVAVRGQRVELAILTTALDVANLHKVVEEAVEGPSIEVQIFDEEARLVALRGRPPQVDQDSLLLPLTLSSPPYETSPYQRDAE